MLLPFPPSYQGGSTRANEAAARLPHLIHSPTTAFAGCTHGVPRYVVFEPDH